MTPLAQADLDTILAWQIAIAWAGEYGDPPRLRWWNTDLVDENAGGDLFQRLLPRTGTWASLASVREVARRVDADARATLGAPDQLLSVFSLGFEVDEALDDRLRELKRQGSDRSALPLPLDLDRFSLSDARLALRPSGGALPEFTVVAGGRQLKSAVPAALTLAVQQLAAVLLATDPVPEKYPLAFFRVRA